MYVVIIKLPQEVDGGLAGNQKVASSIPRLLLSWSVEASLRETSLTLTAPDQLAVTLRG